MEIKGIVLVANMGEDSISVYDEENLCQIDRIILESIGNKFFNVNHFRKGPVIGPGYLYYYKKGKLLLVANAYDDSLSIYNLETWKLENTIYVGTHPNQIAVMENIERAFVTNYDSDSVSIVDLSVPEMVGQVSCGVMPQSILLDTKTNYLYVANAGSNYVSVFDAVSLDKLPCLKMDGYPAVLAGDDKKEKMYIVLRYLEGEQKFCLIEYDLNGKRVLKRIDLGWMPVGILYDDEKERLYVLDACENNLKIMDIQHFLVEKTVGLGKMPLSQCLDTFKNNLYIVCALDNSLYKVDVYRGKVMKKVSTGKEPASVLCID